MKVLLFVVFLAVVPPLAAHLPGTPFPANAVALRAASPDDAPSSRSALSSYAWLCEQRS
jgi:hypothetical protein